MLHRHDPVKDLLHVAQRELPQRSTPDREDDLDHVLNREAIDRHVTDLEIHVAEPRPPLLYSLGVLPPRSSELDDGGDGLVEQRDRALRREDRATLERPCVVDGHLSRRIPMTRPATGQGSASCSGCSRRG